MLTRGLAGRRARQRGLSVVELLIGAAVGLFIVGGAIALLVNQLRDNRVLLLETRVNQDLRSAADLVARDVRRAGYWGNALAGAVFPAASNPYRAVTPASGRGRIGGDILLLPVMRPRTTLSTAPQVSPTKPSVFVSTTRPLKPRRPQAPGSN
ncbi:MAG: hypothetical protein HC937_02780 [Aquincola sp.]|nr:hypothetical protein [Aquincola sp.]